MQFCKVMLRFLIRTHKFSELLVADAPMSSLEALWIQLFLSLCVDIREADS